MAARTLAEFIDQRMDVLHTDTVQIERDYPALPSDWIRGLKLGRGIKQPNRARIKALAKALQADEATLWRYLGRYDEIAALNDEPDPGVMPEWAIRLEKKVDALSEALAGVKNEVAGSATGLAELLALLNPASDRRPGNTRGAPGERRQRAPRRRADPASAGSK